MLKALNNDIKYFSRGKSPSDWVYFLINTPHPSSDAAVIPHEIPLIVDKNSQMTFVIWNKNQNTLNINYQTQIPSKYLIIIIIMTIIKFIYRG